MYTYIVYILYILCRVVVNMINKNKLIPNINMNMNS